MKLSSKIMQIYWKRNIRLITSLLAIWFTASYGIVILLGDVLKDVRFLGTSLPFWFGQQGSILIFLGILIIYAVRMDQINLWLESEATTQEPEEKTKEAA